MIVSPTSGLRRSDNTIAYRLVNVEEVETTGKLYLPEESLAVQVHLAVFERCFGDSPRVKVAEGRLLGQSPVWYRDWIGRTLDLKLDDGRRFRLQIDRDDGFFYATGPF